MANVDSADPRHDYPAIVAVPAPALVSSVPQRAIDQEGVLSLASLGLDFTGVSSADTITQLALDAIATRIANNPGSGGVLKYPQGGRLTYRQGVSFGADGTISIIGGTGHNRNAIRIRQECDVLFNLNGGNPGGSNMHVELGGLNVNCARRNGIPFRIYDIEAFNIHDIRYTAEGGRDSGGNPLYFAAALFDFRNIRTSFMSRIYARNDHAIDSPSDINGVFCNFQATNGSTDNRFSDYTAQGFVAAFNSVSNSYPSAEGFHSVNGTIVGCNSGIIYSGGNAVYPPGQPAAGQRYTPPLFTFMNGHMNCYKEWALGSNIADLHLIGNQLEIAGGSRAVPFLDAAGISLDRVIRAKIEYNTMVSGRRGSLIVGANGTREVDFRGNHGIAVGTVALQQWLDGCKNIRSQQNEFTVTPGANFMAGQNASNNVRSLGDSTTVA